MKDKMDMLLSSPKYTIKEIMTHQKYHDVLGVYILLKPNDSEIVYVGKTATKSIAGRIKDHCNIETSSDLKGMLKKFKDHPQDRHSYLVQYIAVNDSRERTLFEHFLIAILNPRFNK